MSEGIKVIVYVEEYPEHIRKHLISFSFSKTNTCAKRSAHTHMLTPTTMKQEKKKKREYVEKHHSLLSLLCTKLAQSGNYIFSISSPTILFIHYFLATSSFLFLSHIRYTLVSIHSPPVIFLPKILTQ